MPKRAQYIVSWSAEQDGYLLRTPETNGQGPPLPEGVYWLKWLEEHRTFAFHGRSGHINLLKEQRGGENYWYAYRRHQGKMIKRYLGRSEQLSIERLEEASALLVSEDEAVPQVVSAPQSMLPAISQSATRHSKTRQQARRSQLDGEKALSSIDTLAELMPTESEPGGTIQFEPLLLPKLQLPRLHKSLLSRPHLLARLDQALEHKLTVIAGPAGYGKTTLIGQWAAAGGAQAESSQIAYLALDESDNDPIRFWRYIIAACQQFQDDFGKDALELLLAHRLPPFKPLDLMLTALLNGLSQLSRPAVLILDDFHVIRQSQISTTFSFFLDHLPTSCHVIMLIRGDPPFSLARLRARNELMDIYPPHLVFSLEETRAFFEQQLAYPLSAKILRQLYERMDGWPTGLRLLSRELHWAESPEEMEQILTVFAGSSWSIQDYFIHEVLHMLSADQQEFLLQTIVLPRITASLCDMLLERTDSARLIESLRAGDFFLIPLDGTGEWARYSFLFAEAMQQEARRRLGDERLRQLASRASRWYEEHERPTEAIETALNTAEFARAANLIQALMERNDQSTAPTIPEVYNLHRWAERLPEEELERHPDLCLHYAMSLLFTLTEEQRPQDGKDRIQRLLQTAEQKWRDANNIARLAEVFAFRALLARQEGRMLQAVTWARQSLAWLAPNDLTWRTLSLSVVGMGEIADGNVQKAVEFLREAAHICERQGNHIYARANRGILSWASLELGELRQAAEQFRQLQAEARAQEDYDDVARTQLGLTQIAYQWNRLDEAEQAVQEALVLGEQMNEDEFLALGTARLALIEHARGQQDQARQRLISWLARAPVPASLHSYQLLREVQATLARLQLAGGDLAEVTRWFAAIERREESLPLLQQWREQLLRARLLLAQNTITPAIERLESLYTAALPTCHGYFAREVQVVLVRAYARLEEPAKARRLLRELLAATHSQGYLRLFLNEGEEMADLLRGLLPHLQEKALLAYARSLLNASAQESGAEPTQQMSPNEALLLEPLSPQEQKVLRLLAAGNSNAEIARNLIVSVNTIRTHIQSIYRKLQVTNRVEASSVARQLELL